MGLSLPEKVGKSGVITLASVLLSGAPPCVKDRSVPQHRTTKPMVSSNTRQPDWQQPHGIIDEHALAFLDRILSEARLRGLQLRDRLDAQSVLW